VNRPAPQEKEKIMSLDIRISLASASRRLAKALLPAIALAALAHVLPSHAQTAAPLADAQATAGTVAPAAAAVPASAPASAPAAALPEGPPAAAAPMPMPVPPSARNTQLPHELSPVGMFLSADIVVKGVMIGLLLASVAVWAVWMAKLVELWTGRRKLRTARAALAEERSLAGIGGAAAAAAPIVAVLVAAAAREIKLSSDATDRDGLKTRIASRLAEVAASAARRVRLGTGLLASVGATAPFIGLFGTVWGIMNSFIGISKSQTTNLAVVAPGIAEALLATAIGLVAAIPAVLFYNQLSRGIASYKALLGEVTAEIERIVARDLDRASSGPHHLRSARAAE
jgi:biopolymer transport protein ExbB